MTYQEARDAVDARLRFGVKPGLERIRRLMSLLGNPQENLRFIHVAGTNGKGSACAYISSVLREAGYKTGLFISPYVTDFRERFQINGQMISETEFAEIAETVLGVLPEFEPDDAPTEFEVITAIAFLYFYRQKVDIAVLETGLGGRLDSTNVIENPLVSVIMKIAMDHKEILGDTLEKIAAEKAGIIKPGCDAVFYPCSDSVRAVFQSAPSGGRRVFVKNSDTQIINRGFPGDTVRYKDHVFSLSMAGDYQALNAAVAAEALLCLRGKGFDISGAALKKGIEKTTFPSRMERLCDEPLVLLDGSHNPDGAAALADSVGSLLKSKPVGIFGMMKDKDIDGVLARLGPVCERLIAVPVNNPRAADPDDLAAIALNYNSKVMADTIPGALSSAFESGRPVLIFGSLYLASEIRPVVLDFLKNRQNNLK